MSKRKELETRHDELEEKIKNLLPCMDNPVYMDRIDELEEERRVITRELENLEERLQMVKCMEYIARQVNDESVFEGWLLNGVADGDIPNWYDLTMRESEEEALEYYTEPDVFADLMATFLRLMRRAEKSGGLYCGGIVSPGAG